MTAVLTAIVPEKGVRQVYNGTGGTLSKGTFVKLKASATYKGEIEAAAGNTDNVYGVLVNDIADASRGDCQIAGRAIVLAGGTIAEGEQVMPTTGAKALKATSGNSIVGTAVTVGAASAYMEVELGAGCGAAMP